VNAYFSSGQDVISWMQSNNTCKTLRKKRVVRQFAPANHGMLAVNDPALDMTNTDNDLELNRVGEDRQLHRMAKIHDFLEML